MLKHLPNILTLIRIPLAGIFVYCLLQPGLDSKIWAAVIFIIGALTDFLDGYLARAFKLNSNFGKLMDPITDKVLTLSAFGVFAWMHLFPWWMFGVVALREAGITVFRLWAGANGVVLAAETAGKWKTALQMTLIIGVLLFLLGGETGVIRSTDAGLMFLRVIFIGMLAVVVLTLQSGLSVLANSLVNFQKKKVRRLMPQGLARFWATAGYLGYSPKLPGTMTSLVACVVIALWEPTSRALLIGFFLVTALGLMVCRMMEDEAGRKDPSFVVIDEVAGVLAAFVFLPVINWQVALMVFVLFRYFDITKVLGIRKLEAAGGSVGIMLDDILAGIYTNVILQLVLLNWALGR